MHSVEKTDSRALEPSFSANLDEENQIFLKGRAKTTKEPLLSRTCTVIDLIVICLLSAIFTAIILFATSRIWDPERVVNNEKDIGNILDLQFEIRDQKLRELSKQIELMQGKVGGSKTLIGNMTASEFEIIDEKFRELSKQIEEKAASSRIKEAKAVALEFQIRDKEFHELSKQLEMIEAKVRGLLLISKKKETRSESDAAAKSDAISTTSLDNHLLNSATATNIPLDTISTTSIDKSVFNPTAATTISSAIKTLDELPDKYVNCFEYENSELQKWWQFLNLSLHYHREGLPYDYWTFAEPEKDENGNVAPHHCFVLLNETDMSLSKEELFKQRGNCLTEECVKVYRVWKGIRRRLDNPVNTSSKFYTDIDFEAKPQTDGKIPFSDLNTTHWANSTHIDHWFLLYGRNEHIRMPDVIINGISYEEKFWFRSLGVLVGVYLYRRKGSIETDLPLEFVWKVGSKNEREMVNLMENLVGCAFVPDVLFHHTWGEFEICNHKHQCQTSDWWSVGMQMTGDTLGGKSESTWIKKNRISPWGVNFMDTFITEVIEYIHREYEMWHCDLQRHQMTIDENYDLYIVDWGSSKKGSDDNKRGKCHPNQQIDTVDVKLWFYW